MMAVLMRREVITPHLGSGHILAQSARDTDVWLGLYLPSGTCIGVLNTQTHPRIENGEYGQAMQFWAKMDITVLSFPTEIKLSGDAWASRDQGLREFHFVVSSEEHRMSVSARIDDGLLKGEVATGGETIPLEIPVGKNLLLSGNMGTAALNVPGIEPGDEVFVDTFDPMTMGVSKAKLSCVGEEAIEYGGKQVPTKVMVTSVGGITSKAWVSYDDEVIRAETPFGFILRRITQGEAMDAIKPDRDATELLGLMAVRPTGAAVARGAALMRFRLANPPEGKALPEDDTQQREGDDRYVVRTPPEPVDPSGAVLDDRTQAEFLGGDTFVQTDHPLIRGQAEAIIGGETDTWQRAMRVYEWVYASIEKKAVMSLPSALDVLQTREGDCNEHTVLFAALARAAGVPTRIAIGLAWSDLLSGFYYHAWPEVYVGRWTWMDPTLGQPVADATHIKLLTGSLDKWSQLLAYLGTIGIDVLETDTSGPNTIESDATAETQP